MIPVLLAAGVLALSGHDPFGEAPKVYAAFSEVPCCDRCNTCPCKCAAKNPWPKKPVCDCSELCECGWWGRVKCDCRDGSRCSTTCRCQKGPAAKKVAKTCPCSEQCVCGCNENLPCRCNEPSRPRARAPLGFTPPPTLGHGAEVARPRPVYYPAWSGYAQPRPAPVVPAYAAPQYYRPAYQAAPSYQPAYSAPARGANC